MNKKLNNFIFCFYIFLLASISFAMFNIVSLKSPQKDLEGKWQEVSWEYEKPRNSSITKKIANNIKAEISKNLIIHEAEIWDFLPKGELNLKSERNQENLFWTLKGRGNILKLSHGKNKAEHYNIQMLSKDKLILYFNSDIQAKGIVKMTFKKIKEEKYAQEI